MPSTPQDCAPARTLYNSYLSQPPCSPFVTSHLNLLENYETKLFCLLLFAIIFILSYVVYFYSLPWLWSVVVVVVVGVQVQRLRGFLGDALPVPSFNRYDSCARSTLKTESFIHTISNAIRIYLHDFMGRFWLKLILEKLVFVKKWCPEFSPPGSHQVSLGWRGSYEHFFGLTWPILQWWM